MIYISSKVNDVTRYQR